MDPTSDDLPRHPLKPIVFPLAVASPFIAMLLAWIWLKGPPSYGRTFEWLLDDTARTFPVLVQEFGDAAVRDALHGDGLTLSISCEENGIFDDCHVDTEGILCLHRPGGDYSVFHWRNAWQTADGGVFKRNERYGEIGKVEYIARWISRDCTAWECRWASIQRNVGRKGFCHEVP